MQLAGGVTWLDIFTDIFDEFIAHTNICHTTSERSACGTDRQSEPGSQKQQPDAASSREINCCFCMLTSVSRILSASVSLSNVKTIRLDNVIC